VKHNCLWHQDLLNKSERDLTPSLFLCRMTEDSSISMDKDRLKLIVRNLELLVDSLKAEIYSDVSVSKPPKRVIGDYDEIFEEYDD